MSYKTKLALVLFFLGLVGILSMLAADINLDQLPAEVTHSFTKTQLKFLSLVNPTILLLIAVAVGINVHRQAGLRVPLLEQYLCKKPNESSPASVMKPGLAGGVLAGIVIVLTGALGTYFLKEELQLLGENLQLPLVTRLLYGGITEELLLRFGFMSFLAWAIVKITESKSNTTYWLAILLAAFLFAALHLPVVYQTVAAPSAGLILYILAGNTLGGLIFGWLYWKKGLEAAIIGHMGAHIVMFAADKLIL